MKLSDIVNALDLEVRTGKGELEKDVTRGYASDLMSDVMAHADEGDLWITLQIHQNIVAVAVMKTLAGIILVNNRQPQEDTIQKAEAENIPVMISGMPAFELAGKLYEMGLRGV
ncbi:MAG: serine kinase [Deltaproteobacteria bacterium]|nr:serine kinase [Deltaproteobacteria bacterium]MBW1816772.1 serine kinase [Deltaproteobacteria bacterium]MBW2283702.1 serine kinase [Deltaproteobacteria bacterium]